MTKQKSITLEVTGPNNEVGPIPGFRYLWAFYVNGYDPAQHCQPCFRGSRVDEFKTATAKSGIRINLDRMDHYPYVYVCGVGVGPKSELKDQNVHLPLSYAEGQVQEFTAYNGYRFRAENAALAPFAELPEGWEGKDREHTRCKNFRFAVAAFGYPPQT